VTEPGRDGQPVKRWYASDFTLAEIRTLDAGSWFDPKFANARIATFDEAIDLVEGRAGIFPELKSPARLNARGGVDVERAVAAALAKHGLSGGATVKGLPAVYLQSFEEQSVRRLAEVLPKVPRTLLVGDAAGAARWLTADRGRALDVPGAPRHGPGRARRRGRGDAALRRGVARGRPVHRQSRSLPAMR
jgi:glycerophosphoryl diester phosphodiesterase